MARGPDKGADAGRKMELNREHGGNGPVVTGFAGRGFRVGETVYADGLLLSPVAAFAWTAPHNLSVEELQPVIALEQPPEFLLLGTGAQLIWPPRAFVRALDALGIGVEAMDSRAAARAWGVLRSEERWIAAALMPL